MIKKKNIQKQKNKSYKNTMEAFVRRWKRFESRMTEIERKQGIFNPRRQEKRAPTFVENVLRELNCTIERLKEFVEKEN